MKGKFIVITGPSASGKTELVAALIKKTPGSTRLTTVTTRQPRPGEVDKRDYFFVTQEEFEKEISAGDFFEYAKVYGNLYGSSKKVLDETLKKFKYVFAIIDVQGAQTLKSKIPDAFVIFVRPGELEDVHRRLLSTRMGTSAEEMKKRMETAKYELSLASTFDAVIDNIEGKFDNTVENATKILALRV